jgi:hypothetical protein
MTDVTRCRAILARECSYLLIQMSDLGGKLVAAIADSLEYVSCAAVRKFASQAADQHIDRAVQHVSIASACQIEQLISREHATGTVEKS